MYERISPRIKSEDLINLTPEYIDPSKKEEFDFKKEIKNFCSNHWTITMGLIFIGGIWLPGEAAITNYQFQQKSIDAVRSANWMLSPLAFWAGASVGYLSEKIWDETSKKRNIIGKYIVDETNKSYQFLCRSFKRDMKDYYGTHGRVLLAKQRR